MRYNMFDSGGLFVSERCLGTITFGDAIFARGCAAGINFIDTADTYFDGASEQSTGQARKNLRIPRDEVVVEIKVFGAIGGGSNGQGFDPATPIEESLGALGAMRGAA